MNFADAIRKVSGDAGGQALASMNNNPQSWTENTQTTPVNPPVNAPEPVSPHVNSGNVVRLEMFLSAEQMGGLFRAIMAGQHSVMTAREAASYLRISQETLVKLAEEGEIPGVVIENRWRFPKPSLDDWLATQSTNTEEAEDVA